MNRLAQQNDHPLDWLPNPRYGVRRRMALALVGQEVSLLVNPGTITHGIVSEVIGEIDFPQIVVGRGIYDVDQVLTHIPVAFSETVSFTPNTVTSNQK
jgi:hypothetical protein